MDMAAVIFREGCGADVRGMFVVRTSVRENLSSAAHLRRRGVTPQSVARALKIDAKAWVAEHQGRIVAFSIAERKTSCIFALFVLPAYEGAGLGSRLLHLATQWLWQNGADRIWLNTDRGTRAAGFYERRGWMITAEAANGELRFECRRPGGFLPNPQL